MSKSFNRIKLALVAVLFAIVYVCVGTMLFAKAEETLSDATGVTTFQMSGAELIVEGDDGVNGLKFTASISEAEYNALKSVDADFETGVVIMPSYLASQDIEADMFGERAIYDWAIWDGSNYVYPEEATGKIQIININANDWVDAGNVMTYSGAIVDIQDHNETVAFTSIAYIKVVDAGDVVTYAWTDRACTSIAVEVEKATLTESQKAWVAANWTKWVAVSDKTLLLDVAGKESVSAMEFLSDFIKNEDARIMLGEMEPTAINLTKGDAVIDIGLESEEAPEIAVADLTEGVWSFNMYDGDVVLYTRVIDIYNSANGLVWNDLSDAGAYKAYYGNDETKQMVAMQSITSQSIKFEGKDAIEVSGVKTHAGTQPGEVFMTVAPVHTKEYYAQYVGLDVSFNYSYYWSVASDYVAPNGKYIINQYGHFAKGSRPTGGATGAADVFNKWHNASFSLDKLVECWDNIVNLKDATYKWADSDNLGLAFALTEHWAVNGGMEGMGLKFYIAGFSFVADSERIIDGGEVLVKLDDVDKTALDLTSYIKAEDLEVINTAAQSGLALNYEMKGYSIADKFTGTDLTKVDVSEVKEAAYILTVKSGIVPVYTAVIDLYTSTSPVVWADTLTAYNVLVHSGGYTTGRATPTAAKAFEIIDASTVTEETDPLYGKTGTYAKTVSTTVENVIVSVLSLHSKAYYKEMVGNQNYVLTIDKYVAGSYDKSTNPGGSNISGIGMQGTDNYGRWSTWSNYRGGNATMNQWGEKPGIGVYMSLDNYLLRSEEDPCYFTGAWYDFYNVNTKASKQYNMMQFEVSAASSTDPVNIYISGAKIVEASETLLSASNLAKSTASSEYDKLTLEYDFANEKKVDLTTVFDANNLAKYKVYVSKYLSSSNFKWKITFSDNTTTEVKPLADGTTELDLDALASDGATVQSKLEANAKVKIVATSPSQPYPQQTNMAIFNATFKNMPVHVCEPADTLSYDENGHWYECKDNCGKRSGEAAHEFVEGVCVCGYEEPTGFDIKDYEGKYSECDDLSATAGALLTSVFTEDMLADFATLEENGYALTYVIIDANGELDDVYYTAEDIATATLVAGDFELIIEAGDEAIEILFAILSVK